MKKFRAGFTIIEVVLVMAVAGLIFLIAFSALPALQVSSRDTQRRESISTLVSNIKDYQTNNRGALPSGGAPVIGDQVESGADAVIKASESSWAGFYRDYLGKAFRDPLGYMYNLAIVSCDASHADAKCAGYSDTNSRLNTVANKAFSDNKYYVVIVTGATCYGDTAVGTASGRKIAVLYKLEGAGTYCQGT